MGNTPHRSTTHRDIEMHKLPGLGMEVEELAEGGPLTPERMIALAEEQGKPASHYYAAVALATELPLPTAPVTLTFCAGKCQSWGALDAIDRAALEYEKRGGFAIAVKSCLDKCEEAPVCELRTPSGTTYLLRTKPDDVSHALETVLAGS
jgi:hypothetical protein